MPLNKVKSEYPCFWFARYSKDINELTIPKCNICNSYIKICRNQKILCENKCKDIDYSKVIQLDNHELYEFDYEGNQTVPFKFIPAIGLEYFGLANAYNNKNEIYIIDLQNGRYNLNGIILKPSIYYHKENFIISDKLKYYGDGGDLIHFKTAVSNFGGNTNLTAISIGYKCKIKNLNIQSLLTVEMNTDGSPNLYTNFTEN